MIVAYVQNGLHHEAFNLFHHFYVIGLKPNSMTFASILPEYADLLVPQEGQEVHDYNKE